jgi:hypothetical protein
MIQTRLHRSRGQKISSFRGWSGFILRNNLVTCDLKENYMKLLTLVSAILLLTSFSATAQKISAIESSGKKIQVLDMTGTGRIVWGGYEQIGAAARSDTNGGPNTKTIVKVVGKNAAFEGKPYAAAICDSSKAGGHDDWYLPAKDESKAIFANFKTLNLDEKMTLWTSTEASGTQAVTIYLYDGNYSNVAKVNLNHFVCIRTAN